MIVIFTRPVWREGGLLPYPRWPLRQHQQLQPPWRGELWLVESAVLSSDWCRSSPAAPPSTSTWRRRTAGAWCGTRSASQTSGFWKTMTKYHEQTQKLASKRVHEEKDRIIEFAVRGQNTVHCIAFLPDWVSYRKAGYISLFQNGGVLADKWEDAGDHPERRPAPPHRRRPPHLLLPQQESQEVIMILPESGDWVRTGVSGPDIRTFMPLHFGLFFPITVQWFEIRYKLSL